MRSLPLALFSSAKFRLLSMAMLLYTVCSYHGCLWFEENPCGTENVANICDTPSGTEKIPAAACHTFCALTNHVVSRARCARVETAAALANATIATEQRGGPMRSPPRCNTPTYHNGDSGPLPSYGGHRRTPNIAALYFWTPVIFAPFTSIVHCRIDRRRSTTSTSRNRDCVVSCNRCDDRAEKSFCH